jgi:hypothetical protein
MEQRMGPIRSDEKHPKGRGGKRKRRIGGQYSLLEPGESSFS